jgi:hypothetical protein
MDERYAEAPLPAKGTTRGKLMHKKREIATRLAVISGTRLFGQEQWLVDREAAIKLNETLGAMGLCEQVSANTFRNTTLGNELKVDLYEVFMGLWEPWDMIHVLEEHGCSTRMKSIIYSICYNETKIIMSRP